MTTDIQRKDNHRTYHTLLRNKAGIFKSHFGFHSCLYKYLIICTALILTHSFHITALSLKHNALKPNGNYICQLF